MPLGLLSIVPGFILGFKMDFANDEAVRATKIGPDAPGAAELQHLRSNLVPVDCYGSGIYIHFRLPLSAVYLILGLIEIIFVIAVQLLRPLKYLGPRSIAHKQSLR